MAFKKGDDVFVYNRTFSGKPLLEGRARIVKPTGVPDQYTVRFFSLTDKGTYDRFVYAGRCQSDPEGFLADLVAEAKRGGWMAEDEKADDFNDAKLSLSEGCNREMARLGL
jgi:hypothetical protein